MPAQLQRSSPAPQSRGAAALMVPSCPGISVGYAAVILLGGRRPSLACAALSTPHLQPPCFPAPLPCSSLYSPSQSLKYAVPPVRRGFFLPSPCSKVPCSKVTMRHSCLQYHLCASLVPATTIVTSLLRGNSFHAVAAVLPRCPHHQCYHHPPPPCKVCSHAVAFPKSTFTPFSCPFPGS